MWRRPRLVNRGHEKPGLQPAHNGWWRGAFGPGNGDGGGTRADNATAERREACLLVAREVPCLASVASRDTARLLQGWTSLGAPPIPSLGGSAATKAKRKEGKEPGRGNAPRERWRTCVTAG